ncbi:hypothetical protein ACL9RF_04720 [Sphingobacterium sp. Mn56C]|uniref:hypothetical protein n=1 Tax=Sphingobacterium sp. Mn56C TaxID=3395261 RepID=UPI003BD19B26
MIQNLKNFAINWTDGMKISEKHLNAHDNFFLDSLRDTNSLRCTNYNYGLLPIGFKKGDEEAIFEVVNTATNDVHIVVRHCAAITEAGYRIELSDYKINFKSLLNTSKGKTSQNKLAYYVLISANPYSRIPFGDIDPEETPPRHPYTQSKYTIQLLAEDDLKSGATGGNYLIIGKVEIDDHAAKADKNFIPPSTSLHSHPVLLSYYQSFADAMGKLQQYALIIIKKALQFNQNTTLVINVKGLCRTIIDYIANIYFSYRNMVPQQPPVHMIAIFSSLALHIYNSTQVLANAELEEMLNYSFEWSEVPPHALLNQLSMVAEINYDHNNCGQHMSAIKLLLDSLERIFSHLSNLDYIGQVKENIIVNDTDITPKTQVKKGWSLLD